MMTLLSGCRFCDDRLQKNESLVRNNFDLSHELSDDYTYGLSNQMFGVLPEGAVLVTANLWQVQKCLFFPKILDV